jgi:hypothetical protein
LLNVTLSACSRINEALVFSIWNFKTEMREEVREEASSGLGRKP